MEHWNAFLLWLHFTGLALGGAAAFAIPVIGVRAVRADASGKAAMEGAITTLQRLGAVAMLAMIASGLILVWTKYGGLSAMGTWFWIKMAALVGLLAGILLSDRNGAKALAGDAVAAARQIPYGLLAIALMLAVMYCAVLAFS